MKEVLHIKQRPKQTVQEGVSDACSSTRCSYMAYCTQSCFQHLRWHAACHLPARFLFICTGIKGRRQGSWQGGRVYAVLVDVIRSWDGNLEPFYKELWWEGNCFSFHARWKSKLPLKHAESMWSTEKERYTVQTCTRDFLVLGQAERETGRAQSSCPVRAQAEFVPDIWAAGCTFGHRSRTAWKERCSKKKRPHIQTQNCDRRENLLSGKNSAVLYTSGTWDTLYDRLNCIFWIKACHVT